MKTKLKPLEYTLEYHDNNAEFTYDSINIEPFETILDTFDYEDIEKPEWRSKYNHFVVYDYEPFCPDGFLKCRHLEFKSEQHIKFFLYLLDKHLDNIKQIQVSYNTNREIISNDEID